LLATNRCVELQLSDKLVQDDRIRIWFNGCYCTPHK